MKKQVSGGQLIDVVAIEGTVPTSGTVTLGAGTASIGKLGANAGVDIGNVGLKADQKVNIGTIDLPTGLTHGQFTAPTGTATQINGGASVALKGLLTVKSRTTNAAADIIYVGGAGVTVATGYPLSPGETVLVPAANLSQVYAIAASGTPVLAWMGGT